MSTLIPTLIKHNKNGYHVPKEWIPRWYPPTPTYIHDPAEQQHRSPQTAHQNSTLISPNQRRYPPKNLHHIESHSTEPTRNCWRAVLKPTTNHPKQNPPKDCTEQLELLLSATDRWNCSKNRHRNCWHPPETADYPGNNRNSHENLEQHSTTHSQKSTEKFRTTLVSMRALIPCQLDWIPLFVRVLLLYSHWKNQLHGWI
jgi:hypothetical protein